MSETIHLFDLETGVSRPPHRTHQRDRRVTVEPLLRDGTSTETPPNKVRIGREDGETTGLYNDNLFCPVITGTLLY